METMGDFVKKLKKRYDISSDYGMAKILGLSRQTMSAHKSGRAKHFSEETAYKIGELTNEDPAYAMVVLAIDRAKDEKVREAWRRVARIMRSSAPAFLVVLVLSIFVPSKQAEVGGRFVFNITQQTIHYAIRRWLKKWRTCLLSPVWGRLSPRQ